MTTQVWSCGGGVQSAAIGALIVSGRLPKPDLAVIADTERERSSTWAYFDSVLHPALLAVGVDIVRVRKSDLATVDLWGGEKDDTLLIPAFTQQESGGKFSGYCSNEWKKRVIDRWLRSQGIKCAVKWIGISLDEMRRVRSGKDVRYPLIFDVPMRREGCIKVVRDMVGLMPHVRLVGCARTETTGNGERSGINGRRTGRGRSSWSEKSGSKIHG
jgi:hypothetical protein